MIRNKDRVLDDIARVAGGTVSVFSGLSQNIREEIRARTDEMAARLDLIPREDFERLETVLEETRKTQQEQEKRIKELEKQLGTKAKKTTKKTKATKSKK